MLTAESVCTHVHVLTAACVLTVGLMSIHVLTAGLACIKYLLTTGWVFTVGLMCIQQVLNAGLVCIKLRLGSLLLYLCYVVWALINSLWVGIFWDTNHLWWLFCLPIWSFFLPLACPGQYICRCLQRGLLSTDTWWCGTSLGTYATSGFASALNWLTFLLQYYSTL